MICRDTPTMGGVSLQIINLQTELNYPPWVGVWVDGWVSGSMGGSGQITKNLINLDLIEKIQFCLKIYHL